MRAAWLDLLPRSFRFHNPLPLRDGDLELIAPCVEWVDELLMTCAHPLSQRHSPDDARLTRSQVLQFLRSAPDGHEPADPGRNRVPTYHFWMIWHDAPRTPYGPPVHVAGGIGLRVGSNRQLDQYYGHVGYHVFPPARGHRFAERATRLLLPLARQHQLDPLWITCNPDNWASRVTIERLGGELVNTVAVPPTEELYRRGEHFKCRYRVNL